MLAWSKPKTKTYKGVRIFKAPYVQTNLELTWKKADEIYYDNGNLGVITANYSGSSGALMKEKAKNGSTFMISKNQDSTPPPAPPSKVSIGKVNKFDKFDPPDRTDSLGRSKTVTFTIRLGITPPEHPVNIDDDGNIMYYFEDTDVKLNE